jgi:DNA primase
VIPPSFLQDLLLRTDVVEVVGRHVELKRAGANWMGLCPFHGEKSPSFSVSPSKQFYHCFGCGANGNAYRFLTEHLGLSFVEAVRDLAQGAGMQVPEEQVSPDERERRDTLRQRRHSIGEVMTRAADFYRAQLRASPRAIDYLKGRGLSGAAAARFNLGFAPPGWRTLAGVFGQYDDPLLEEAGLVRQRQADEGDEAKANPSGRYDWFRDRIMFPIRSVAGDVIGFGGRVFDDSKPKYINSPETPLFSKGRELYGLFEARQALRDKGYALVVEGYMDVVALAQSGFPNAVATLGTACTAEHVQKLFRFTDAVVFSFDGDAAGRRAAGRALEAALPFASDLRSVRFLFLPPEHDPDTYVRQLGPAAFEAQVVQAVPLSRQLVVQASADADLSTAEGRARLLAQAKPLWAALPEGALKMQLLPELARQAQLGTEDLHSLWGTAALFATNSAVNSAVNSAAEDAGGNDRTAATPPRRSGPRGPFNTGINRPARSGGRRAPAASADLALRLLLRHSDWWERLAADDQSLLHNLGGLHGVAVAWLERQLTEHGPMTWAALDAALADADWQDDARAWVGGAATADEEQVFTDLQRVIHRLWKDHLGETVKLLIAEGRTDREQLDRITVLSRQIAQHRAAEALADGASPS